jgi:hypothetical protein
LGAGGPELSPHGDAVTERLPNLIQGTGQISAAACVDARDEDEERSVIGADCVTEPTQGNVEWNAQSPLLNTSIEMLAKGRDRFGPGEVQGLNHRQPAAKAEAHALGQIEELVLDSLLPLSLAMAPACGRSGHASDQADERSDGTRDYPACCRGSRPDDHCLSQPGGS